MINQKSLPSLSYDFSHFLQAWMIEMALEKIYLQEYMNINNIFMNVDI